MLNFSDIKSRLIGISCPFFGVSWNPPEQERTVARRIIRFLEDRRVLYSPSSLEIPHDCVESVFKVREYLTKELQGLSEDSNLFEYTKAMRIACRKFLDRTHHSEREIVKFANNERHYASWVFFSALGEMRGTFGNMIAQMAAAYGIDIEDDLATILPDADAS